MTDPVTRLNAALGGRYAIERELGEGGMATVYLADDLKHERKVALKVLKPDLAAVVGAERFLAEIKTTANLQHPHILPLFDSGEADSFVFYVMPFVEGETLQERITREKQLPVEESVRIATAVANALQTAHDQGIVHRDIKPANILLSRGEPLIADFGISLAVGVAGGDRLTETGLSLGTPFYMSPEQATGEQFVGSATDTYALGAVLYEMLTGDPPYMGSTAQAVLGQIIAGEGVSATKKRASVPANVDAALRCALEKLPADRFTSAQDFARALGDERFRYGELATAGVSATVGPWNRLTMGFAAFAAVLMLILSWVLLIREQPLQVGRFELVPERQVLSTGNGINIALSPDGSRLVYAGQSRLWQRRLDQLEPEAIPGTEGARNAVVSPDGASLAFNGDGSLQTVSLSGGPTLTVVASGVPPGSGGLDWGSDGMLYFTNNEGAIQRVPASGGEPTPVTTNDAGTRHQLVDALPEGRGLLFTIRRGSPEESEIAVMGFEDGDVRTLFPGAMARYATSGHLVYAAANGFLLAAPFDLEQLEVTGPSVGLLERVVVGGNSPSRFALSETGTLLYVEGWGAPEQRLLVVDLEQNEEAALLDPRAFLAARWSPGGESVAYHGTEPGGNSAVESGIYTYDVASGTAPRGLTFEGRNGWPVWSPDGTRVAFASIREGTDGADLFVKTVNDDSPPQMVVTLLGDQVPTQWPSDDVVIFESGAPSDLWMVDMSSDSAVARPYLESEGADLDDLRVSPSDGDLAAYTSNESGADEVYVRSFPVARQPEIVSQGGGAHPLWSKEGNTIYYWTLGGPSVIKSLIAARIERGPPFAVISRDTVLTGAYRRDDADLHPDGDRLVIPQELTVGADATADRFIVVTNWFEELRQRMGN